jgi:acetolactate synthase-1/2/3 large subunit
MVTYKAKGVVPDDHPSFAGIFTNAAIEEPIVAGADLVIGVGLDPVELIPRRWPYPQPVVYCGPWRVDDRHVPFAAQLIGDVPTSLRGIEDALPSTDWDLSDVRHLVELQRRQVDSASDGLTPHRVVCIAAERLASGCRVTVDAGAHMFPTTMLWPVFEPNQMLISNGLSTMGFALPAAIGAALVDRRRAVVALTGDGGLLMCLGELLTAARERLRIIVIVFNDAALSLIKVKQQQRQYNPTGVDLGPAAWRGVAEAFGVTPFMASSTAELEQSVEMALDCEGPALIDARVDPADYGSMLRTIRG